MAEKVSGPFVQLLVHLARHCGVPAPEDRLYGDWKPAYCRFGWPACSNTKLRIFVADKSLTNLPAGPRLISPRRSTSTPSVYSDAALVYGPMMVTMRGGAVGKAESALSYTAE